jgi:hypothetical protein
MTIKMSIHADMSYEQVAERLDQVRTLGRAPIAANFVIIHQMDFESHQALAPALAVFSREPPALDMSEPEFSMMVMGTEGVLLAVVVEDVYRKRDNLYFTTTDGRTFLVDVAREPDENKSKTSEALRKLMSDCLHGPGFPSSRPSRLPEPAPAPNPEETRLVGGFLCLF